MDENSANSGPVSGHEGSKTVLADYLAQCREAVAECFRLAQEASSRTSADAGATVSPVPDSSSRVIEREGEGDTPLDNQKQ